MRKLTTKEKQIVAGASRYDVQYSVGELLVPKQEKTDGCIAERLDDKIINFIK